MKTNSHNRNCFYCDKDLSSNLVLKIIFNKKSITCPKCKHVNNIEIKSTKRSFSLGAVSGVIFGIYINRLKLSIQKEIIIFLIALTLVVLLTSLLELKKVSLEKGDELGLESSQ